MAYVTAEEWVATGGHLGPDEDDAERMLDRLDAASRYLDRLLCREWPLETHTCTRNIMLRGDRKVRLGSDRPTACVDQWAMTVTGCLLYDPDGTLQETVTAGSVGTLWAGSHGFLLLPSGSKDNDGWTCRVTYTAGFAVVPDVLREATIDIARGIAFRDLDQRDPVLDTSLAGAWKARAAEVAAAHEWHAVA